MTRPLKPMLPRMVAGSVTGGKPMVANWYTLRCETAYWPEWCTLHRTSRQRVARQEGACELRPLGQPHAQRDGVRGPRPRSSTPALLYCGGVAQGS